MVHVLQCPSASAWTDQLFKLIFNQQRPPYTPTFIPLFRYSVFRVLQTPNFIKKVYRFQVVLEDTSQ